MTSTGHDNPLHDYDDLPQAASERLRRIQRLKAAIADGTYNDEAELRRFISNLTDRLCPSDPDEFE